MDARESPIRWGGLVKELASHSSMTQVGQRVGVSQREVSRWTKEEIKPQGHHAEKLIAECERMGINWRKYKGVTPVYDFRLTYDENVSYGPQGIPSSSDVWIPPLQTKLFDMEVNSPIGVPASALTINSKWIGPLANLGFDVITAKTVRTKIVPPHPSPNCVYIPDLQEPVPLGRWGNSVRGTPQPPGLDVSRITLANSFGMPSIAPHEWQADLHRTRSLLRPGQVLIASVVGTPDNHSKDNPNGLISDFVKCAMLAHEAGPHAIELNFSCPNVYGKEGSIYHDPDIAARICKRLQKELPNAYVLLKIGYLSQSELDAFFKATYRYVAGYTAINTLSAKIISDGQQQEPAFPGANRINAGVSGVAIKNHALDMVRYLGALAVQKKELAILGVGGVSSASDVKLFLEAGANAVQICTAALLNPFVAVEIRKELARERAPMHESRILHKAGLHVPFRDDNTAKVFDTTLKVVERMNVPFDAAYGVVHSNWLASYLKEIDGAGQGERTRRNLPTEQQIEAWLNSALRKNS